MSGLWHGANYTFVIWGALHGIYQVIGTRLKRLTPKLPSSQFVFGINVFVTFLLVNFAWIFFRAYNVQEAFLIIKEILNFNNYNGLINLFHFKIDFFFSLLFLSILLVIEFFIEKGTLELWLIDLAKPAKWALMVIMLLVIMVFGKWNEVNFLYFQF